MTRLLREPLLHFLVLGGGLFVLFQLMGGEDEAVSNPGDQNAAAPQSLSKEILVTPGRIASLAALYEKTWQRKPSDKELDSMIDEFVREEILYRQALALGLDRDDAIVRRRMRQKIEFFTEDLADLAEPTDADLEEYLAANPDSYRLDPQFTFRQVYLNAKRRGEALDADLAALLTELQAAGAAADISAAGDSLLLEQSFEAAPQREVAKSFGREFAASLLDIEPGSWQGPVRSGFGVHLVFVSKRVDGGLPPLEEVRSAVARDWSATRREESNEALFEKWRSEYTITIERPNAAAGGESE